MAHPLVVALVVGPRAVVGLMLLAFCGNAQGAQALQPPARSATHPLCCVGPAATQPAAPDVRGTVQQPLVVSATLPPKNPAEVAAEARDRAERYRTDWWTITTGWLTIIILAVQAAVFIYQAERLKES